jgi:hypothetical protein
MDRGLVDSELIFGMPFELAPITWVALKALAGEDLLRVPPPSCGGPLVFL